MCWVLNILDLWEGFEYLWFYFGGFKYVRVLNICCVFSLIWQGSQYASGCNYERVLNIPGFRASRFLRMEALHKVSNMPEYGWIMPYGRVLNMPGQRFTGF